MTKRTGLTREALAVLKLAARNHPKPTYSQQAIQLVDGNIWRLLDIIETLESRWLIRYERGSHFRVSRRGLDLLETAAYRARG